METYTTHKTYSNHYESTSTVVKLGQATIHGHTSGTQFTTACSTLGHRNPKWRDQIRAGQNATTDFSGNDAGGAGTWATADYRVVVERTSDHMLWDTWDYQDYGYPFYPVSLIQASPTTALQTNVNNRAIASFLDACDSATSSFELGQDLGEYKETLNSIRRPVHSLYEKLLDYGNLLTKARSRAKGPSLRKVLADTYLEWRFGINPLVSDVASAFADAGRFRFPVIPVSAGKHGDYNGSNTIITQNSLGNTALLLGVKQNLKISSKYSVRYKGAVRSGSDAQGQISRTQAYQLTPDRWLPTAWDLLPYSWVVDYFTNVGDMIHSLSFINSRLAWGCRTTRTETVYEYGTMFPTNVHPYGQQVGLRVLSETNSVLGGNASFWVRDVARGAVSGQDLVPEFEFRIPTSKYPYANLAALAMSKLKRLTPFF